MKHILMCFFIFSSCFLSLYQNIYSQHKSKKENLIFVDKQGILRWSKDNKEAAFFGVNYTVPFAYGYRSHQALGVDLEKAIDQDVYHFARLGFDAFRVHVWDTEITDSTGNLKENDHLRLFDYLVSKLQERNIKIFLTPLAFWGNGYPEKDEKTGSFSNIYNKQQVLITENAIKAQENYLQQLLRHVNPYTNSTYGANPDIIALEINNEPHHTGTKQQASGYISRMINAIKSTGWTKPIFYNISESPRYADAVAKSAIDGVSFQWYPTGLVANRSLKGNYLPNVDLYKIPFADTIPEYRNKALMVYEFDAGDIIESYMYPAMARSFRTAGFQWATQFAYDPLATAYGNTEYQTHYLNLAYTPSKAISLMITSEVFHKLPRLKNYGIYPADSVFDVFRVSYKNSLSEMNNGEKFYYSNSTTTEPKNVFKLKHIAGVGNSPVVEYKGTGAYFLDKISDGIWRLEVMPDAIHIRDPFEKASPKKEVTRIQWQKNRMQIMLDELGSNFDLKAINDGNTCNTTSVGTSFLVQPGIYIVANKRTPIDLKLYPLQIGTINITEFVAPKSSSEEPFVNHTPNEEVLTGRSFSIKSKIVGVDSTDKIFIEIRNSSNQWKKIACNTSTFYDYVGEVPADIVTQGLLDYRIIIQKSTGDFYTFPGNYRGDPYSWDYFHNDTWQTLVVSENLPLKLFDPKADRDNLMLYNPDWKNNVIKFITADSTDQLILRATMNKSGFGQILGWQYYFADKLSWRKDEISSYHKLVIKARTDNIEGTKIKVALILNDGSCYAVYPGIHNNFQNIEIPLSDFKKDSALLLPRPYPGFLPLYFKTDTGRSFNVANAEKLEISFGYESSQKNSGRPYSLEIGSIWLKK